MNRRTLFASVVSSLCVFRVSGFGSNQPLQQSEKEQKTRNYTLRKFTAPFYPLFARQAGIEGKTTAVVHIATDGSVTSVSEIDGHPVFAEVVSNALKEWQFDALSEQLGQIQITFQFRLRGVRDQRILNYKVSGALPTSFEVEVNPFPDINS